MGRYSQIEELSISGNTQWSAQLIEESGSSFKVLHLGQVVAELVIDWAF